MVRLREADLLAGDIIRRAAVAMRESGSNDLIVFARVALEAAIRDEIDLLDLLPEPNRRPARPAPVAAMALV